MNNCWGRYLHHLCLLRNGKHKSKQMRLDFEAHGEAHFVFHMVCECDDVSKLTVLELEACRSYGTFDALKGYNLMKPFDIRNGVGRPGRPMLATPNVRFCKTVTPELAASMERLIALPQSERWAAEDKIRTALPKRTEFLIAKKLGCEIVELKALLSEREAEIAALKSDKPVVGDSGQSERLAELERENERLRAELAVKAKETPVAAPVAPVVSAVPSRGVAQDVRGLLEDVGRLEEEKAKLEELVEELQAGTTDLAAIMWQARALKAEARVKVLEGSE